MASDNEFDRDLAEDSALMKNWVLDADANSRDRLIERHRQRAATTSRQARGAVSGTKSGTLLGVTRKLFKAILVLALCSIAALLWGVIAGVLGASRSLISLGGLGIVGGIFMWAYGDNPKRKAPPTAHPQPGDPDYLDWANRRGRYVEDQDEAHVPRD
jgi:hypothetical protein